MVNSLSRNNVDECDEIWSVTESRRGRWSVERGWQGPPAGVPRPELIQLTINRATSYVRIRRPTQARSRARTLLDGRPKEIWCNFTILLSREVLLSLIYPRQVRSHAMV